MPNFMFTDYAAASVVGSKSILGGRNDASQNIMPILGIGLETKIRCRLACSNSALLVLLCLIGTTLMAVITMIFRRHRLEIMRQHLYKPSPGRIFITMLRPEMGGISVSSRQWSQITRKIETNVAGNYPTTASMSSPLQSTVNMQQQTRKSHRVAETSTYEISSEKDYLLCPLPIPQSYADVNWLWARALECGQCQDQIQHTHHVTLSWYAFTLIVSS